MGNTDSSAELLITPREGMQKGRAPINTIYDANNIPILEEVTSGLGIKFEIIKKAGEKYTINNGIDDTYTGTVADGKAFVSIGMPAEGDLTEFWQQVKAKEKELSPKTT